MPTYDFKCDNCGHVIERNVSSTVCHLYCMACNPSPYAVGGEFPVEPPHMMQRQPSAPSFTVKGFNAKNGYSK